MFESNLWGIETSYSPQWRPVLPKFESNLWGIETYKPQISAISSSLVWIEPVRDWNSCYVKILSHFASVWIEPVRDWNISRISTLRPSFFVWIEPVRDWNTENLARKILTEKFESNLWGIETLAWGSCCNEFLKCLNRTCEGLKLFKTNKQIFTIFCLNRTCEGLKPFEVAKLLAWNDEFESNLWGIETLLTNCVEVIIFSLNRTCEGLKPTNITNFILLVKSLNRTCEGLKQN